MYTNMHDFGALAVVKNINGKKKRGFKLYVGGGLGAVPHQAKVFDDFIDEEELLPIAQAIGRVFARLGEKKNRARARIKFLVAKLGIDVSVRTVDRAKLRCRNTNGATGYSNIGTTNIQVHTAQQSGIDERAIPVANALGNGTYTDDASRIFHFKNQFAVDTPQLWGSSTNYLGNSDLIFSEDEDPDTGVENTHEATIRLGVMKYDVTDYSTGYLPVGPDRSGDTGAQYITLAFRRQVVSNFDINITSAGIAGLWIAAPGTAIDDASGLDGWIDASTTYGGSGVPGSDTGNGGNGSNGCAFTSGDRIATGTALSGGYTMTLGSENMSNAQDNVALVRIKLTAGQTVTAISIGVAS